MQRGRVCSRGLAALLTRHHPRNLPYVLQGVTAIVPLQMRKLRQRDTMRATPSKLRVEVKLLLSEAVRLFPGHPD